MKKWKKMEKIEKKMKKTKFFYFMVNHPCVTYLLTEFGRVGDEE